MEIINNPAYRYKDLLTEIFLNGLYAPVLDPILLSSNWFVWAAIWIAIKIIDIWLRHPFILLGAIGRTIMRSGSSIENLTMLATEFFIFSVIAQLNAYNDFARDLTKQPAIFIVNIIGRFFNIITS